MNFLYALVRKSSFSTAQGFIIPATGLYEEKGIVVVSISAREATDLIRQWIHNCEQTTNCILHIFRQNITSMADLNIKYYSIISTVFDLISKARLANFLGVKFFIFMLSFF